MVRAAQKGEAKAPSPEVSRVASRIKKSDAKDFASTKHKGLPMKKKGLSEEGYDRMRDAALEKGTWKGGGGQPSTGGAKKTKGKTVLQKETEKKYGKGKSALDIVKKNITDKYGKDAIMKTKNEGTSYGITRGSGKPSGQMAAFGKQDKKENPYSIKNKLKMVIKGAAEKNRKKAGVTSEAVYTGPDKKDRAVINKMYDKKGNKTDFAKKAAEYEKNMDPKKRQALKDKATKGMKFTHEEAVSEAKYEAGASDYGKTSIRNKRAFGKGGNAADPKERGGAKMLRHDSHTKRRGVKKNNKYGATNKPPVDGAPSDEFKKDRYATKESYSANPKQQAAIAIAKKKKKEDDMVAMKKKKQKVYSEEIKLPNIKTDVKMIKGIRKGVLPLDQTKINSNLKLSSQHTPEGETIEEGDKKGKGSGSKDACYHKVKSRYSVWPSAYASGALVKCRKVGAANWGNSSKKEDFSDWKAEFIWEDGDSSKKIEETVGKIKQGIKGDGFLGPTVGGLGIPNPIRITKDVVDTVNRKTKNTVDTTNKVLPNSAKMGKFKEFNPTVSSATTKLLGIKNSYEPEGKELDEASPAWQRKEGKSESGGLNKKGVASYRAANPGSKLKTAVTTKPSKLKRGSKSAKRRKSFCSRMKGMKKKLTSAKTARDPDSRINKALRKWNC